MTTLATQSAPSPLDFFKNAGLATSKHDDREFEKMATASGYLPRLQQFTDASSRVKKRELTIGFYFVTGKDDLTPLGEDIDIVPLAWRFKALDTSGPKPVSTLDQNSDLFKSIASRAKAPNSNCQAGIEYLVWVPAVAKFATYLMGSKTAIKEAGKMKPFLGCSVTIKTHTFDNGTNIWMGPKVFESSVPSTVFPDPEIMKDTVEKFVNPPAEATPEPVEEVKETSKRKR